MLLVNVADVTATEPSVTGDWSKIGETVGSFGSDVNASGFALINSTVKRQTIGAVGTNQTLNCSLYNWFSINPTADITLDFTNVQDGTVVIVELTGGGDWTTTWTVETGGSVTWDGDAEPAWATGTNRSVSKFLSNDGANFDGGLVFGDLA